MPWNRDYHLLLFPIHMCCCYMTGGLALHYFSAQAQYCPQSAGTKGLQRGPRLLGHWEDSHELCGRRHKRPCCPPPKTPPHCASVQATNESAPSNNLSAFQCLCCPAEPRWQGACKLNLTVSHACLPLYRTVITFQRCCKS